MARIIDAKPGHLRNALNYLSNLRALLSLRSLKKARIIQAKPEQLHNALDYVPIIGKGGPGSFLPEANRTGK